MTQHDTPPSASLQSTRLLPLRGPSGKLYGELDVSTGVITFRRGKLPPEHIDLTPYFKAATVNNNDSP